MISAWNTVKYGRPGHLAGHLFRPGFSRHSPCWVLGRAYHSKLTAEEECSPVGDRVGTFCEGDSGIEAFRRDYSSKVGALPAPGHPALSCG